MLVGARMPPSGGIKAARPISGLLVRSQETGRSLYTRILLALITAELGHLFGCYWIYRLVDAGFVRALAL